METEDAGGGAERAHEVAPCCRCDCYSKKLEEVEAERVVQRGQFRRAKDDEAVNATRGRHLEHAEGQGDEFGKCLEGIDAPAVSKGEKRGLEEASSTSFGIPWRCSVELRLVDKKLVIRISETDLGEDWNESGLGGAPGWTCERMLVQETPQFTATQRPLGLQILHDVSLHLEKRRGAGWVYG